MRQRCDCGFTLLELLIVLVIVAISVSLVGISLGERHSLEDESQRLARLLEQAQMEARTTGYALAWSFEPGSYHFFRNNNGWELMDTDEMFHSRNLTGNVVIAGVKFNGVVLAPKEKMLFTASGLYAVFSITLADDKTSMALVGGTDGRVRVEKI